MMLDIAVSADRVCAGLPRPLDLVCADINSITHRDVDRRATAAKLACNEFKQAAYIGATSSQNMLT